MKGERQNKTPIKHVLSTKIQFLTNTNSFSKIFSPQSIYISSGKNQDLFSCSKKYQRIL